MSVVIPVKNVARWLPEALDSVLGQRGVKTQIIVVDNGSTDDSFTIAQAYADKHSAIEVVSHPHGGTGGARNAGVARARGELLTFADPDDIVLPGAWKAMSKSLRKSGSDFVVGHFERLHPDLTRSSLGWADRVHARARTAAALAELPEIIGDVFVWNKMFRTAFWRSAGIVFPENTRYQDQGPITEAFLRASAFDVLPRTVYLWRLRSDASSVTQRRGDLDNLHDRDRTKRAAWEVVRTLGAPTVIDTFSKRVMPGDMHHYFAAIPGCSDDYWSVLRSMVCDLWGGGFAQTDVLPVQRLLGWLVEQDRRDDAATLADYLTGGNRPLPVTATASGEGLRLDVSALLGADVPDEPALVRPTEWGWQAVADQVDRGTASLRVRGTVRIARAEWEEPFDTVIDPSTPTLTCSVPTRTGPARLTGPVELG